MTRINVLSVPYEPIKSHVLLQGAYSKIFFFIKSFFHIDWIFGLIFQSFGIFPSSVLDCKPYLPYILAFLML